MLRRHHIHAAAPAVAASAPRDSAWFRRHLLADALLLRMRYRRLSASRRLCSTTPRTTLTLPLSMADASPSHRRGCEEPSGCPVPARGRGREKTTPVCGDRDRERGSFSARGRGRSARTRRGQAPLPSLLRSLPRPYFGNMGRGSFVGSQKDK